MCLTGTHILILEDTPSVALYLSATLKRKGCTVSVVETVDEAEGVFEKSLSSGNPVALVLADLNLEGHSGLEFMSVLKGHPDNIPVIMMSADGDNDSRQRCFVNGATAFFEKPFDICVLLQEIDHILDKRVERHVEMPDDDFQAETRRLHQRFHAHLQALIQKLDGPMSGVKFRSLVHQTKGSAAIYGYTDLSAFAASLSQKLVDGTDDITRSKKKFQRVILRALNTPLAE